MTTNPFDGLWLERICAALEDSAHPAVITDSGFATGRELIGKAVAAADTLLSFDLQESRPVPALLTTNADALALLLAGGVTNRPLAPLAPRQTVAELAAAVRRTESPILFTETSCEQTAREVADIVGVTVVAVRDLPVSAEPLRRHPGPTAMFLHTAGTTGAPKCVAVTDSVLGHRARLLRDLIHIGPGDRFATGSPLHHIGGVGNVLVALTAGAGIIATTKFSFDWWRGLNELAATHCLLVPSMIEMLLTNGLIGSVPLRTLIYGASPIAPDTLQRVLDTLPNVAMVSLYGQTEGSPITSLQPGDHRRAARHPELLRTVGRPVGELRLKIDDPDGHGVGEVLAAADHLSVLDADGWLHTGDLGVLDDDGYLRLRGRMHDMVVRGGENVYPLEVENALSAHPGVASVGVVGVPDTRLGETLAAFVVPVAVGHAPDEDELRTFVRRSLAGYKIPQYWYFVAELPLNAAGKVIRGDLRASHARLRSQ
ncbi:MAG: class I adenylate-forming enzyme family protein [Mycobacterium sp.]